MLKALILSLLSLIILHSNTQILFAANPLCSSRGVQLYTTDSKGNSVGPAKGTPFNIEARSTQITSGSLYKIELTPSNNPGNKILNYMIQATENGKITQTDAQIPGENPGPYLLTISDASTNKAICDSNSFRVLAAPLSETELKRLQTQQSTGGCILGDANCTSAKGVSCGTISGSRDFSGGIETAIGCIPTKPQALIEGTLKFGTLAAGGIAFLLMIFAALQMITAEGNPQNIKNAQEKFYSAIIGLLFIIFSVLLLQVIGYDILGLPGFGK